MFRLITVNSDLYCKCMYLCSVATFTSRGNVNLNTCHDLFRGFYCEGYDRTQCPSLLTTRLLFQRSDSVTAAIVI